MTRIAFVQRLSASCLLAAVISLTAFAGVAMAAPGDITGLTSTTHPLETTWCSNANPSFSWNPVLASPTGIDGYSFIMDQIPGTIPDLTSDRVSVDYLTKNTYTTAAGPSEVRVGDLNGDGNQDIVTANANANSISVLLGNGDGTFRLNVDYPMTTQPWSLQLADLNGDGKLDVVTGDLGSSKASVRLNNGNGTFGVVTSYTVGVSPECMRIGDLNGDGYADIVTTNAGANTLSVLINQGNGTFNAKIDYATPVHPTSLAIGDMNGDGKMDLITANTTPNSVSILTGKGDGTFNAKVDYGTGATPYTVEVADINGDGKLDVLTANYGAGTVSVLSNMGDGTLNTKVDYPCGAGPYSLDVRDLNQDGIKDIVTINNTASTASILMGKGDGTFATKRDYAAGSGPFWLTLGDFNNDGYGDLVSTDYTGGAGTSVSVRLGSAYLAVGFTGKADGIWYLHIRALDMGGNGGATATRAVRIDTTAPTTTQTGAGSAWHDADVTVNLVSSDGASGVASSEHKVDSGSWTTGTSLVVAAPSNGSNDGAHTVSYRSTDAAGNVEVAKTCVVNIVTSAPTTSVSGADSAWHTSNVTLSFASGSLGVSSTEYKVDGGSWTAGSAVVIPALPDGSNDGQHTVLYRSTNGAGLVETAKSCTVKIDLGAPTTTVSGAGGWHDSDVTLDFAGTDAGSGVAGTEYRIDGGAWTPGSSAVVLVAPDGSSDGTHVVQYRSTDALGHVETAKSCNVNVVTAAPSTIVSGADSAWHTSAVTLTFSASGLGVATTEYRIDGGGWVTGVSVVIAAPADGSNDGAHTVGYRSINGAGLVEGTQTCTVNIDNGAPTTSVSGADSAWHASDVTLGFSGSDAGSGVSRVEYRLDGGGWVEGSAALVPAPPDGSNDGTHTVEFRSTDALGHVEPANSIEVNIDTGAPTTTQSGADGVWHGSDVTVDLSASDGESGVASTEYRIDGGPWTGGSAVLVAAASDGSNDGAHTISYRSADGAGNTEATRDCAVNIDTSAPVTTDNADLVWHTSDVTITLAAGDPGSGVASTEYRIDGGPWTPGSDVLIAAPADHSADGDHTVDYRSVDNLGHTEAAKSFTVMVGTLPVITESRQIRHKLYRIRADWAPVTGTVSYEIVVNGNVVITTDQLRATYRVQKDQLTGPLVSIEVYARDGGGTALAIGPTSAPW